MKKKATGKMIILGIDPGYAIVGWGVIDYTANRFQVLSFGAVTTEAKTPFNERLETVYDGIQDIINKYKPDALAIEKLFYNTNAKTVIDVAHDGGYTRLYIAYFDRNGKAHKPFLLPQRNPYFYGDYYKSYNVPEFMAEPVTITPQEFARYLDTDAQAVNYRSQTTE